jgi:hypothetical protein
MVKFTSILCLTVFMVVYHLLVKDCQIFGFPALVCVAMALAPTLAPGEGHAVAGHGVPAAHRQQLALVVLQESVPCAPMHIASLCRDDAALDPPGPLCTPAPSRRI